MVALTELGGGLYPALLIRPAAALAGFIAVAVAFVILGGCRYSVDAVIGREF